MYMIRIFFIIDAISSEMDFNVRKIYFIYIFLKLKLVIFNSSPIKKIF